MPKKTLAIGLNSINQAINEAKTNGDKRKCLFDGGGLYLLIRSNCSPTWQFRYRFDNKLDEMSLGVYPLLTLAKAREKAIDARRLIADGINPRAQREDEKKESNGENSFEAVALKWMAIKEKELAASTYRRVKSIVTVDLIPALGDRPMADIKSPEVVMVLQRIEKRSLQLARKAQEYCSAIAYYAIATGKREDGRVFSLRRVLGKLNETPFPTFKTREDLIEFQNKLDNYGCVQTRLALKLLMLTFVRPIELASAPWDEFNLETAEWLIPGKRMKMKVDHIVPLSTQALAIIQELRSLSTTESPWLLPHNENPEKHMARDTFSNAMRNMGYQGKAVPHGFRSMASTMLNEMGFNSNWIEKQLAHATPDDNKIRAKYNHALYLPKRKKMMQRWGDYLDSLMTGAKVLPFRKASG